MNGPTTDTSRDWLSSKSASVLAWWIPLSAIVAGLFVPVPLRTAGWVLALGWMSAACMLNARRCGRTHCRYTGPYYLALIAPVVALGTGLVTAGVLEWISLGVFVVGGSGLIWWATERTWGKFSLVV
jgi:hypothetical protein